MKGINAKVKKLVAFLNIFICLFTIFNFGAFAAGSRQTVRIPCEINDLLRLNENGEPVGYCKDYLNSLAAINNWQYEYVETNWNDAVKMLENGEIDLLFPTNYTEERAEDMSFSNLIGGYTSPGLFAPKGSSYVYEDFKSFDGARIGVTKGSSNEYLLNDYAEKNNFSYVPVYLGSVEKKMEALEKGEIDMVIFTASNDVPNSVLVALLDPQPFYYTVKKGNDKLLQQLNNGMQEILLKNNDLISKTFKNCLFGENVSLQAFTREEKDFIQANKEIVVGFYENSEPLAYVRDGTAKGVYPTILNYVKEQTKVNFVLKPIDRTKNWQDLLDNGEIDFFLGASASVTDWIGSLKTTRTLVENTNVIVTKNDCDFNSIEHPVIALTYGQRYWERHLPGVLDDIEIKYYKNTRECLEAIFNGEVDGSVLNSIEYNYQSKNPRFSTLIPWENYRFNFACALISKKSVDDIKFNIANHALDCLTGEYVDYVLSENLSMPYESTIFDSIYASRNIIFIIVSLFVSLIAIFAAFSFFRKKQNEEKVKAREHERHQLKILAALSHDYESIYYADLDKNECEIIRENSKGSYFDIKNPEKSLRDYVDRSVMPEYKENLLAIAEPKKLESLLKNETDFSVRYQIKPNSKNQSFFEMHFVNASENENEHFIVFGIRCVDDIVKEEIQQKQLLSDALEAAKRASSAKSDFLSKMSHDIRTPMNAIIGMTAIAAAHINEPDKIKDSLGKITASSRHLLGLINEVLDMSKIESGNISLNEEEFNICELVQNLVTIIQPQIKSHKHQFSVFINEVPHEEVIGDSLRLEQVFLNILSNAVKYTPDGGKISLTVSEIPSNTPKAARYEFIFEDNGIGMSAEYLEHIFEPFTRAEDLRTSKIQGTGLGMTITQNIVRMMNGTINVESEVGKGSKFTVNVFLKLQENINVDISELADLSVLVVDDNIDACSVVCGLIDEIGMECKGVYSGADAVEETKISLESGKYFNAAIIDWKMPEMDGLETAKRIKALTDNKLPVIILSAYDWSEIEDEAREAGVDAFLSKPIYKSSLVNLFKRLKNGDETENFGKSELRELEGSNYSDKRVLLVEDNELNLEIASEILQMTNINIDTAANGEIAVEKFSQSEPGFYDIILMDIQMPVMNGYEAAKAIRRLKRNDALSVPIIAMTANAFTEDIQNAKKAGMNEHLSKPIDFNKLNDVLRKYLSN